MIDNILDLITNPNKYNYLHTVDRDSEEDDILVSVYNTQYSEDMLFLMYNIQLLKGMVVCGGLPCSMLNYSKDIDHCDVDIFMYGDIDYVNTLIKFEELNNLYLLTHNNNYCEYEGKTRFCDKFKVQVILRKFKSISDILNGFDLDASQVAIDHENLYYTDRFLFSYQNKINIFNINKASPSYIHRLNKYKIYKGYDIVSIFGELKHSNSDSFDFCSYYSGFELNNEDKIITNMKYFANIHDKFWYSTNTYLDARSYQTFVMYFSQEVSKFIDTGSLKDTKLECFNMTLKEVKDIYERLSYEKRPSIVFAEEGLNRYRSYKKEVDYYLYFEPILTPNHYPFIFDLDTTKNSIYYYENGEKPSRYLNSKETEHRLYWYKQQLKMKEYYITLFMVLFDLSSDIYSTIIEKVSLLRIRDQYDRHTKESHLNRLNK